MLNLLHRHLLREILVTTVLAIALFVFVLLVGNALRDVAEILAAGKLGLGVAAQLVGHLIPYVAAYALPLGMLTGTLIALGRLSSQREITAMKSAGWSLFQITSSVFFISCLFMVIGVILNLHYAPKSRLAYKELIANTVSENPIDFIQEGRFIYDFPGYVIYMGGRDGALMEDFWIWELNEAKQVTLFLRAASGTLDYDVAQSKLVLTLFNGTAEKRRAQNLESFERRGPDDFFFGEFPIALSLSELFGGVNQRRTRIKEMTLAQLLDRREAARKLETTDTISKERMKVQLHIQKNLAMAFSVFSLAVFGVPLAIRVGRKETYANLGIALIIALAYYFLVIAVSWLEEAPHLRPDLLIWLPNLIFQAAGLTMLYRASKN